MNIDAKIYRLIAEFIIMGLIFQSIIVLEIEQRERTKTSNFN
jgi:hypothetical protein